MCGKKLNQPNADFCWCGKMPGDLTEQADSTSDVKDMLRDCNRAKWSHYTQTTLDNVQWTIKFAHKPTAGYLRVLSNDCKIAQNKINTALRLRAKLEAKKNGAEKN